MLLLAAAFITPKAWAQAGWQTLSLHNSVANDNLTAAGLNSTANRTYPKTGLTVHVQAANCPGHQIITDPSTTDSFVLESRMASTNGLVARTNQVPGLNDDFYVDVVFDDSGAGGTRYTHSEATLTVLLTLTTPGCTTNPPDPLTLAWAVTVSDPWTDAGSHSDAAASVFSPVIIGASASRTETGLAFHQSPATCRQIDVALASGAPDSVELVRYDGNSPASNAALSNIHMESGNANDNHVKLMFKAGATLTAGDVLTMTVNGTSNSSCSVSGSRSYEWKVTVGTPASWVDGADHDVTAADDLALETLNAATTDTYTGLAFHRTAAGCDARRAVLASSSRTIFGLHKYDGSTRETSSLANDVPFTGTEHVRIYLRSSYQQHTVRTLQASLVISGDCDVATKPAPLTLAWPVTVVRDPDEWRERGDDETAASGTFSRYDLLDSTSPTATGIQIHRSSDGCTNTDVALATGTPAYLGLDVHGDGSGVALAASQATVPMPGTGAGDRHVRLYFVAGANAPAGVLAVTATISAGCAGSGATQQQLVYRLTVSVNPDAWRAWDDDETAASGTFSRYDLLDSTSPTATGIQIHRSSDGCANTNVALAAQTPAYLGLDVHGDGSGVALASSQAAVPMPGSGAGDRHVRLYFAAGADAPAGVLAVTATISAACAGSGATPQQLVYRLTVYTPAAHAWEVLDDDRQTPGSSFEWSAMVANPLATGIQLHRNSEDCKYTDVELLSASEYLELARYTSAGAVDGTPATRLAAVRMEEGVAADRHVRLRFRTGVLPPPAVTARLRVAAAAGCGTRRNPAPVTFSYVLNVDADFDPAPQLRVTPLNASIARNAATTGIRATATDNDDADVAVAIDAAAARIFELQGAAGRYELRVRTDVSLAVGGYTVVFTATDDNGGPAVTAQATATIMVREGSGGTTGAAAVDAGGAVVRALGMGGIDEILNRPAPAAGAGTALLEMLAAKEHELERGEIDLAEFLDGQAVALPLQQAQTGGVGIGVWLAGGRRDVGGVAEDADDVEVYIDGELTSANFGLDLRFGRLRAGLGYGLHETTATYGREADRKVDDPSEYELDLQLLQPYVAFDFGGGRAALAAATGSGDLVLRPDGEEVQELEADYLGYAVGVAQRLPLFGDGELRLRGSYAAGELDVAELADDAAAASMDSEGNSLRMILGYGHEIAAGQAASFTPFIETGYLLLDGDGAV
ncbi:MAG: hypothetical protein ISN26_05970, partial [Betaproteobacteria bacterium AqS2]|nr:hypothetical protein [Betaproteobacteria bacterium AqS2]